MQKQIEVEIQQCGTCVSAYTMIDGLVIRFIEPTKELALENLNERIALYKRLNAIKDFDYILNEKTI